MRRSRKNLDERGLVNDRPTREVMSAGRRLHGLQLGRSDQAYFDPFAQNDVDRQDVPALRKSSSPKDEPRSHACAFFGREILTPGDHFHAEREPDSPRLPQSRSCRGREDAESLTRGDCRPL